MWSLYEIMHYTSLHISKKWKNDLQYGNKRFLVKNKYSENGVIKSLISLGLSDITVKIENETVHSLKSVLCLNPILKDIIMDSGFNEPLVIDSSVNVDSFYVLERWLSGNHTVLTIDNVINVIYMSIIYNQEDLYHEAFLFFISHLNEDLVFKFIQIYPLIRSSTSILKELIVIVEEYLYKNGFQYFLNMELLQQLSVDCVIYLVSKCHIIIPNEMYLFKIFVEYYNRNIVNLKNEEEKNEFEDKFFDLLKIIQFQKINIDQFNEEENSLYNKYKSKPESTSQSPFSSMMLKKPNMKYYIGLSKKLSDLMMRIVLKYFMFENDFVSLNKNDLDELRKKNLLKDLKELFLMDNLKVIVIGLLIITDLKIPYEFKPENKKPLIELLVREYKTPFNNLKESACKSCICLIDDVNDLKYIQSQCKDNTIIYSLCNYIKSFSITKKNMFQNYLFKLNIKPTDFDILVDIIPSSDVLKPLFKCIFKRYTYSDSSFTIKKDIPQIIQPKNVIESESKIVFDISPPLPHGMALNSKTGEIVVYSKEEMKMTTFSVIIKYKTFLLKQSISLEVV